MFYGGIYRPSETKHLNDEAKKLIGSRLALQEGWRLMDGPYRGQYCLIPRPCFGLIPACDLKGVKNISYGRWKEIHNTLK
jgi:hypothetical protein